MVNCPFWLESWTQTCLLAGSCTKAAVSQQHIWQSRLVCFIPFGTLWEESKLHAVVTQLPEWLSCRLRRALPPNHLIWVFPLTQITLLCTRIIKIRCWSKHNLGPNPTTQFSNQRELLNYILTSCTTHLWFLHWIACQPSGTYLFGLLASDFPTAAIYLLTPLTVPGSCQHSTVCAALASSNQRNLFIYWHCMLALPASLITTYLILINAPVLHCMLELYQHTGTGCRHISTKLIFN